MSRRSIVLRKARSSKRQDAAASRALLAICGRFIQLIGAGLAMVTVAANSLYYAIAGFGLIFAGTLLARRKRAGAWVYLLVFAVTLAWSLRNVDRGGTSLTMRLFGPVVLLAIIAILMPALRGWPARRAIIIFSVLLIGTVAVGISWRSGGAAARSGTAATEFLASRAG